MGEVAFKHPDDNHGGADKGACAQLICRNYYESKGYIVDKTPTETDKTGIDFVVSKNGKSVTVSCSGTFGDPNGDTHLRICYCGIKDNNKIPGVKRSKADIVFAYNQRDPDYVYIAYRDDVVSYIEKHYKESTQDLLAGLFVGYIDLAVSSKRLYQRARDTIGSYDLIAYVPMQGGPFKRIEREINSYKGVLQA